MNLTAIRDINEARIRHFEDSAALIKLFDLSGKSLIDVGTGAGFPGLVLKILEPSLNLTLLDATEKKVRFLRELCKELEITGVECLIGRAEELGKDFAFREQFDIATVRGVAPLPALAEICLPFLKVGGTLMAMKERMELAPNAKQLGGEVQKALFYKLSNGITHTVIRINKVSPTSPRYPRSWAVIMREAERIAYM